MRPIYKDRKTTKSKLSKDNLLRKEVKKLTWWFDSTERLISWNNSVVGRKFSKVSSEQLGDSTSNGWIGYKKKRWVKLC